MRISSRPGVFSPQQFLQRRDRPADQPAGNNQFEVAQIGSHVQRNPVHGHTAPNPHTHSADLRQFPIVRHPGSRRFGVNHRIGDADLLQGIDHNRLKAMHVATYGELVVGEADDRIDDDLPRAVKGNVPTTVALDYLDSQLRQLLCRSHEIPRHARPAAEGDHRLVLDEEHALLLACHHALMHLHLVLPGRAIRHPAKVLKPHGRSLQ